MRAIRARYEDWLRDGSLALVCGVAITALLLAVLQSTFDPRLSDFFAENSVEIAHGHNIVNVILVDFRGLDTLGEISVVMAAGIAILALLRRQHKREPLPKPKRAPRKAVDMNTLIFRTMAPVIAILMVMFSVVVLLRGHNEPGGGFIGGLIAASAIAISGMAFGVGAVRKFLRVNPLGFAGFGVLARRLLRPALGILRGAVPDRACGCRQIIFGVPGVFDIGVYFVVFGTISAIALALEDDGEGV